MQPSSTIFVYLLGIITIAIGIYFLKISKNNKSRKWWGFALLFWGFGALSAGTSYQAFSYEIKCAGKDFCSWTSWWEIYYILLTAASISSMLIAFSFTCLKWKWKKALLYYAIFSFLIFSFLLMFGAFTLSKFLISFEFLLVFAFPNIVILFIISFFRYFKTKNKMDFYFIITWIWLAIVITLYFSYLILGFTDVLWKNGFWFSENDVLHIALISWMFFIAFKLSKEIKDA